MDHATLLANIPMFESLTPEDLQALSLRTGDRDFKAGEAIFREGEEGATLFIIEAGAVEISVGEGKAKVVLASLSVGQYFGELSLLDGAPRSATATATKAAHCVALDRDDFVEFIKKKPEAALRILSEMGERIRQTNALMSRQVSKNVVEEADEHLTFGQRIADRVAAFGGSWPFIGCFGGFMALWMITNTILGEANALDIYPFILLNLMLSTLAALQAPVIMMSQNRQAVKDKLLSQNDYQVNLKNEIGIDTLLKGQAEMMQRLTFLERQASFSTSGQKAAVSAPQAAPERPKAPPVATE
jgi:CRP/FNR family transcriptional regulator, cyclic AMP receptor protein